MCIRDSSANIPKALAIPETLRTLHDTLSAQDSFDIQAIKTRSMTPQHFITGDHPEAPYLHLTLALLQGRTAAQLKNAGDQLFSILQRYGAGCKISLEIRQMDSEVYWK